MQKTHCFIKNLLAIYPHYHQPTPNELKLWQQILSPYSPDEILKALRTWHKKNTSTYYPTPKEFAPLLVHIPTKTHPHRQDLPFNPETYLMEQDIKNNTCHYLYPDYVNAVRYLLNVELKKHIPLEQYKTFSFSKKYSQAVELGLFANFHQTLENIVKSGVHYD